jgi:hypothetical protein
VKPSTKLLLCAVVASLIVVSSAQHHAIPGIAANPISAALDAVYDASDLGKILHQAERAAS